MDNASDIIQTALDSMGQTVELVLTDGTDVTIRRGVVASVTNTGGMPFITLNNYSFSDGEVIVPRTVIALNEIISLSPVA